MKGLSPRNLGYMKSFAEAWPDEAILQAPLAKITWYHNLTLLEKVKPVEERLWYAQQTVMNGWSRNVLVHQIETGLYGRQGKALTNFQATLPKPQSDLAQQILKDPYNFDFLTLSSDILERDLERGLLEHLRDLILELGKGHAFVGSQYHIEVGGQDFYLDLLFYHLHLRCYIVYELKIEEFKPEFAGKMNFYLSAVDDQLRHPGDGPTLGIILCKDKNEVIVEYALRDSPKPMGVSQYQLTAALPEKFEHELPTRLELARDFPLLSLVKLRIEIERELRSRLEKLGGKGRGKGIVLMLRELERQGAATMMSEEVLQALRTMNEALHGFDEDPDAAEEAIRVGTEFLEHLRKQ